MLKRIFGVIVGVVLVQSSAFVPPTNAASATMLITQVQAGVSGGATKEFITLYNNSAYEVDISDWCLRQKTDVAFACFYSGSASELIIVPPYSHALIASNTFADSISGHYISVVYEPLNQSSGSLVGSNDRVVLVNALGEEIDRVSWTTAAPSGSILQRSQNTVIVDPFGPIPYLDTDDVSDWTVQPFDQLPFDQTERRWVEIDYCSNLEGVQSDMPPDMIYDEVGECVPIPIISMPMVIITELLPNVTGADDGNEYIELFNYGSEPADLSQVSLEVGVASLKTVRFPAGTVIQPQSYMTFRSSDMAFTLTNAEGQVGLRFDDGTLIDQTPIYVDAKDDMAWALINGFWEYTNQPTPDAANLQSEDVDNPEETVAEPATPAPCAANQYRSPETNRCRLIRASVASVTPCRPDQYRSPETNRCRTIAVAKQPTPCKEGQERNLETNRCRNIKVMPVTDYAVLGVETASEPDQWYIYLAIGLGLLAALLYGAWEWRKELRGLLQRIGRFVRRRK